MGAVTAVTPDAGTSLQRSGVADLVLVTGFGAPGQAPDELVRSGAARPGWFGLQEAGGGGPDGWIGPFGTKGCDQHRRPAGTQVRGSQPGQRFVARLPDQPGQSRASAVAAVRLSGSDGSSRAW